MHTGAKISTQRPSQQETGKIAPISYNFYSGKGSSSQLVNITPYSLFVNIPLSQTEAR